ncbi:peptidoglycan glycosyltransferase FtsW [Thermodesulforhabdus norvegica]|uniref:Probable peptidoglycan glycosyltransferase FtsW n=1 Tax=Thermodesulforhabdus norvegica TaxID=39841 RepID=A0A1I4RFV8_9BACT|nr:putative peptidoglycan glycosyltransferase FtsW [Thermodesulforhabdus norvegica]SFM51152.1 cell division protein FtsW [Thermodesulforhabdus norvegica]
MKGNKVGELPPYAEYIVVLCTILLSIGLVLVYSASAPYALEACGFKEDCASTTYLLRHLFVTVGFFVSMFLVSLVPLRVWYRLSRVGIVVVVILLTGLLIPGVGRCYNNACRWYVLFGGFHFQPSEYAKLVWAIYLADALYRHGAKLGNFWRGLVFYTIFMAIISGLILAEPDFGNAVLVGVLTVVMLAAAGVPWRHFAVYVVVAAVVGYFFVYRVDYRWQRVIATYSPWQHAQDQGYQIIQSWIALGSGGLFGQGLGSGLQKLRYLPEPFTDFIVAVAGHELGFAGIFLLIFLFAVLFWVLFSVMKRIEDDRNRLLATGLYALLAVQVVANGAVVTGLLPTKGLPMPFLSYGGSHTVATGVLMGLWLRLIREEIYLRKKG